MKSKVLVISIILVCLVAVFSFLSEANAKILNKGSGSGSVPAFIRVGACYNFNVFNNATPIDVITFRTGKIFQIDTTGWVNVGYFNYDTQQYDNAYRWLNIEQFYSIVETICYDFE